MESTNINLTETTSQKNNTDKKENNKNEQNSLYFVKTGSEKEIRDSNKISNYNTLQSNIFLINNNNCFNFLLKNLTYNLYTFKLIYITFFLCYCARDNIEDININNIIRKVRLV